MQLTVGAIAKMVGGTVHGNADTPVTGVNGIQEARPGDLTFVRAGRYAAFLETTKASAVLMAEAPVGLNIPVIVTDAPDLAFAQVLQHFELEQRQHPVGIHKRSEVEDGAVLGKDVALAAFSYVSAGSVLGDGVVLYPGVFIGRDCEIGAGTVLFPNVTVREGCKIGARCIIHANTAIGSDGFGFAPLGGQWMKIPQIGIVVIGDDVEIGSNSGVDRATFGETRIGTGTKIDNLVQIGHNACIGEHCVIAGETGIAGSAIIKDNVRIGAQSGVAGHLDIGAGATVAARAGVTKSIDPGAIVSGFPAMDHNKERRIIAAQRRTPELIRRVKELERRLAALQGED